MDTTHNSPVAEDGQPRPLFEARTGRLRRAIFWIVGLVLLAGGGVALYGHFGDTRQETVAYRTGEVTRGPLESRVTATGTLLALVTVQVGSQVTGTIKELLADFNSTVRKGQVIARMDARLFAAEVARARASLATARANQKVAEAAAHEARLQYERDRDLARKKVVALAEVETRLATFRSAQARVAAAKATLAQARASLAAAEIKLAYTTIVSPINGVVVSRSVDVGQTVSASLSAPTLFTIAEDLRKMEVHTSVAESDVGQVRRGMKVRFTVDAFPRQPFQGEVKQVRYAAQTVQNVVTYDAVVIVANDKLKLRPGMTANVSFIVASRDDVLRLPSAALRFSPRGLKEGAAKGRAGAGRRAGGQRRGKRVWVLGPGGELRPRQVRTGISDGGLTEILEGARLRPGERVIVGIEAPSRKGRRQNKKQGGRWRRRLL